jgi:two-component system nitrate/nitrite response regulator NarL
MLDSMSDLTGSEILAAVNAENLLTRLVFFTASVDQADLVAATSSGVCSMISKSSAPERLVQSLRQIVDGWNLPRLSSTLDPSRKATNDTSGSVLQVLTDRESEIMRLVSKGLSNKEIARRLNISQGTTKVHLHHIYQKLEINNRTVLAALAISRQ